MSPRMSDRFDNLRQFPMDYFDPDDTPPASAVCDSCGCMLADSELFSTSMCDVCERGVMNAPTVELIVEACRSCRGQGATKFFLGGGLNDWIERPCSNCDGTGSTVRAIENAPERLLVEPGPVQRGPMRPDEDWPTAIERKNLLALAVERGFQVDGQYVIDARGRHYQTATSCDCRQFTWAGACVHHIYFESLQPVAAAIAA
jgi:hypothetical protein